MKLKKKQLRILGKEFTFLSYVVLMCILFASFQGVAQINATVTALDNQASETAIDNATFRITVSGSLGATPITVNYTLSGTATSGDDYAVPVGGGSAVISIPILQNYVDIDISGIVDDNLVEESETVVMDLQNGVGYTIFVNTSASIEIIDNDKGIISVDLLSPVYDPDAAEAGLDSGMFRINMSNPNATSNVVTVNYTMSGTAVDGTDYTVGNAIDLTFANNGAQVVRNVSVNPIQDFFDEVDETATITLDSTSDPIRFPIDALNNQGTVTIVDDDTAGFDVATTTGSTNESGTTVDFLFKLTSEPTADITIPINQYDATETSGPTSVVITPANWNIGETLTITGVDDDIIDGDVLDVINTGNPSSGDPIYHSFIGTDVPQLEVTNVDNDVAGVNVSVISGNTNESGGTAFFTITLDNQPTDNVTILLSSNDISEGTVQANAILTPSNWDTGVNVTITGVDDQIVDGDTSYSIITGNVTSSDLNYGPITGAQIDDVNVTNNDNDNAGVNISPSSGSTNESGTTASFLFTLTSEPAANVTIPINGYDSNEHTGAASVVLSPLNWNTGVSFVVTGVDDQVVDGDITYDLNTGNVTSPDPIYDALIASDVDQIALTNVDDDSANVSIQDASANEDVVGGNLVFDVTLDVGVTGGTTVPYSFIDGTATGSDVDYDSDAGSITFVGTVGEVQQIEVAINDDTVLEDSEEFTIQLGTPSNNVSISGGNSAIGTINDDDNCVAAPILNTDVSTFFCDEIDLSLNAFTNSVAPSGTVLKWSTLSEPLNVNAHLTPQQVASPPNDGSFFGFFYDETNNCASGTIEVVLTLNDSPIITATQGGDRCGPGIVALSVEGNLPNSVQAPTFNWYDSPTMGNLVDSGDIITPDVMVTTLYYVEAVANGCVTERVEVTATIYPVPNAGMSTSSSACSVAANGPTTIDLDELLDGESMGEWTITTDPSNSLSIGLGNTIDFESMPDGDYIFTFTTTDATPPFCENLSSEVTISVNDCDVDSDLDGLFDGVEILLGTATDNVDSDEDGIEDGEEVGMDINNPLDEDNDGIIDALDSNVLDADMDGVVDQLDPANTNACIPDLNNEFCVSEMDLEIALTVDNAFPIFNSTIEFEIIVTNISEEIATEIMVREILDGSNGFVYVSHEPTESDYNSNTGIWTIPSLEAGENTTLIITVQVPNSGTYINTVSIIDSAPDDSDLSNNEASVEIEIKERSNNECGFLFNQFSPNGDGTNDRLVINCILQPEFVNNSLEIFDRYGNQVFSAKGYDNSWDGTKDGKNLPKGTYFYILDLGDDTDVQKGWIQIIR